MLKGKVGQFHKEKLYQRLSLMEMEISNSQMERLEIKKTKHDFRKGIIIKCVQEHTELSKGRISEIADRPIEGTQTEI